MKDTQPNQQRPRRRRPRKPVLLQDHERYRLLFGPYEPPIPKRGYLVDAVRGKLPFGNYSNALIPWPRASRRGKNRSGGYILCGDLLRAVKMEAIPAICHHWGVSHSTVIHWRQALELTTRKSRTPGAERLVRLGVELARLPQSRKKSAEAHRGLVMSARHKKRFHGAMHKGWRERFKARRAAWRRTGRFPKATKADPWIPEEDKLMSSQLPTVKLAKLLGRSSKSIQHRRLILGIRSRPPINQKRWQPGEIKLLGTDSDAEIARQLGRSIRSVSAKRRKLSISPPTDSFWTPEQEAIIGQIPDAEAARRLGRTLKSIQHRRQKLGMRFFERNSQKWTTGQESLLGTDTDAAIAERLGRSKVSVATKRREKGIAAKLEGRRPWTPGEIAVLGTMSDVDAARKLDRTVLSVRTKRLDSGIEAGFNRRWRPDEDKLLGTLSDAEVGARVGRTPYAVLMRRSSLHIRLPKKMTHAEQLAKAQKSSPRDMQRLVHLAPATKRRRITIGNNGGLEWTMSEMQLLGKVPDEEAARRLRRSLDSIKSKREKLHIPVFRPIDTRSESLAGCGEIRTDL